MCAHIEGGTYVVSAEEDVWALGGGGNRGLHNEELHNAVYSSPELIQAIK
jgi:hypothetical protein